MTWGAIGGAVIGVAGSAMQDSGGGGGGGTQTQSRDPWGPAAPWLMSNLVDGQNLQNWYKQNPFSAGQQQAYGNLAQGTNYVNQLIPQLLSQLGGGGFDRTKPLQRPAALSMPAMNQGLLQPAGGTVGQSANPWGAAAMQAPAAEMPDMSAGLLGETNGMSFGQRMRYLSGKVQGI